MVVLPPLRGVLVAVRFGSVLLCVSVDTLRGILAGERQTASASQTQAVSQIAVYSLKGALL